METPEDLRDDEVPTMDGVGDEAITDPDPAGDPDAPAYDGSAEEA